jgi:hypothetical protein
MDNILRKTLFQQSKFFPQGRQTPEESKVKKVAAFFGVVLIFLGSSAFGQSQPIKGEVRSPSGKLIYKTYTRGNVTETREPSGKLITKSKTNNGTTEVRSPSGKLLYKVK